MTLRAVTRRGPRMARVTLGGPALEGFAVDAPAASVRLLVPGDGEELVVPTWRGNEFLLPDGRRPVIRTFTPLRAEGHELDIDVVLHGHGAVSRWAEAAEPGWPAAVSGPGRGYAVDTDATHYLLAGDETALPAIGQLLAALPTAATVEVHVEVAAPDGRIDLAVHPGASVTWHDLPAGAPPGDSMVAAVTKATIAEGARVWVAGEAAAVQRVRRHLFEERGLSRSVATVRGYWKHGRSGDAED